MKVYHFLIMTMLILISVFSVKNFYTGQWDMQYAIMNGGMAIIVFGIYSGYIQLQKEQA